MLAAAVPVPLVEVQIICVVTRGRILFVDPQLLFESEIVGAYFDVIASRRFRMGSNSSKGLFLVSLHD